MTNLSKLMMAASLALGLSMSAASAQAPAIKPASPAAIGYAKEILTMKNAAAMYAGAVPNIVQRTKDSILQNNLNYQKDLNEVSVVVAQQLAGKEKEIGEGFRKTMMSKPTAKRSR